MAGSWVIVASVPPCDVSAGHGKAYADAAIPGGPWGNFCRPCFDRFGCSLGTGRGQVLMQQVGKELTEVPVDPHFRDADYES